MAQIRVRPRDMMRMLDDAIQDRRNYANGDPERYDETMADVARMQALYDRYTRRRNPSA